MIDIIETTLKNLEANGMETYSVADKNSALEKIKELIAKGSTVAVGGSETLNEIEALNLLRNGSYDFLDRYKQGLSREEVTEIFKKSFFADYYICSSNAITQNGELYNVDGNCNRISALSFGPQNVIVVAGVNKIVPDLSAAVVRVKAIAAPKNCVRLGLDTYCSKNGHCVSIDQGDGEVMGAGCMGEGRICCTSLVTAKQRIKNRIKIILVNEHLGY